MTATAISPLQLIIAVLVAVSVVSILSAIRFPTRSEHMRDRIDRIIGRGNTNVSMPPLRVTRSAVAECGNRCASCGPAKLAAPGVEPIPP